MATFRNRHGKWQARVARKGTQSVSKSFQTKQDAERLARQVEADIDKGSYINVALAERTLFKDIIERHIQEVTLQTRSMREDRYRLSAMMRHLIGKLLDEIGHHVNLFATGGTRTKGRKQSAYCKLDLNDPEQLIKAIELLMPKVSK